MVLCETFFRVVGKITHVLSLFYYVSEYILRAFSLSLSLSLSLTLSRRDHRAAQTRTRTQRRIISHASSLFLSLLKFCFSSVFISFIDTKTRDSFKQQRSVAHRIWTLLELDACTVHLL